MRIYSYSQARQKLAEVLAAAEAEGKVIIRRRDGRLFALVPELPAESPLDVPVVKADIATEELVALIRQGRERP